MRTITLKDGSEVRLVSLSADEGYGTRGVTAGVELADRGGEPYRYWGLGLIEQRVAYGRYGEEKDTPVPEDLLMWGLDTEFCPDSEGKLTYPLACRGFGAMGCSRSILEREGELHVWLLAWAAAWTKAGRPTVEEEDLDALGDGIEEKMRLRAEVAAGQGFLYPVEELDRHEAELDAAEEADATAAKEVDGA